MTAQKINMKTRPFFTTFLITHTACNNKYMNRQSTYMK